MADVNLEQEQNEMLDVLAEVAHGTQKVAAVLDRFLGVANKVSQLVDYETAVGIGQQAADGSDTVKWVVGYLAVGMVGASQHGQKMDTLNQFAADCGMSQAEMREVYDTAHYFPPDIVKAVRDASPDSPPTWSHFNRARRGLEFEEACDLVMKAGKESWSVHKMESEIQAEHSKTATKSDQRRVVKRAISALGDLAGKGLPKDIVDDAKSLRTKLERYV